MTDDQPVHIEGHDDELDGNGWPTSWGIPMCFGPMGVIHPEPFPHYVGQGCHCDEY